MNNLERFIELCVREWPDLNFEFILSVTPKGRRLYVQVAGWQHPAAFDESSLMHPHEMIHALKDAMIYFPLLTNAAQRLENRG